MWWKNAFAATIKNPNIGKASDSNGFNFDEIAEMAKKYINKLVPVNSRVEMPKAYSLAEVKLELPTAWWYHDDGEYEKGST